MGRRQQQAGAPRPAPGHPLWGLRRWTDLEVRAGDVLILSGRDDALEELDTRRADASGDRAYEMAKADQDREVAEQQRRDRNGRDGDV